MRENSLILFLFIFFINTSCSKKLAIDRDGPGNIEKIVHYEVTPKKEKRSKYGNPKTYKVFGVQYKTLDTHIGYSEEGIASWYGKKYHGNKTSTGEIYDMYAMTGAHKILPLPSYVKVTNLKNKKWVIIRLNDRGPFLKDRIIDLSYAAAHKLDIIEKGSELVEVELINPKEYEETLVDNQNYDENYLQVGAFKDFINSQTLLDKINNLKMLDNYEAKNIQINNLFHILIGPIKNSGELNKIKENLESEYNLTV